MYGIDFGSPFAVLPDLIHVAVTTIPAVLTLATGNLILSLSTFYKKWTLTSVNLIRSRNQQQFIASISPLSLIFRENQAIKKLRVIRF